MQLSQSLSFQRTKVALTYDVAASMWLLMIEGRIVIIGDNNVAALRLTVIASGVLQMEHVLDQETAELLMAGTKVNDEMIVVLTILYTIAWSLSLSFSM